jgi:DNA-directed RNA polymerase subunit RPC12/RpoP
MTEHIVGQPLVEITVYQCPHCSRIVTDAFTHTAYTCPFGCPSHMKILRTEYQAQGPHHEHHGVAEYSDNRTPVKPLDS